MSKTSNSGAGLTKNTKNIIIQHLVTTAKKKSTSPNFDLYLDIFEPVLSLVGDRVSFEMGLQSIHKPLAGDRVYDCIFKKMSQ